MTDVTYPKYLMVRDTGLADDLGGLGQRIYTTAGAGYPKQKYVRSDAVENVVASALLWAVDLAQKEGIGFLEREVKYLLESDIDYFIEDKGA